MLARFTIRIVLCCAVMLLVGCLELSQLLQTSPSVEKGNTPGHAVAHTAISYTGVPYVWGGTSPKGFDCSGLTYYACKQHGINIPRTSLEQSKYGKPVNKKNLRPGDLVFFTVKSRSKVDHVGMYLGNDMLVHAPGPGLPVTTDKLSTYSQKYKGVYHSARRVAPDAFPTPKTKK